MSIKSILVKAGIVEDGPPPRIVAPAAPPVKSAAPAAPRSGPVVDASRPPAAPPPTTHVDATPPPPAPEPPPSLDPARWEADLGTLYRDAGIPSISWGAEEALDFLSVIPVEESDATRRRSLLGCIVALSRKFPGLTAEAVAKDARLKAEVLRRSLEGRSAKQAKFEADTQREIEALRTEIQQRVKSIDARKAQEHEITQRFREHAGRLARIDEFLRPDVAPTEGVR